jgi:hypothetical protein
MGESRHEFVALIDAIIVRSRDLEGSRELMFSPERRVATQQLIGAAVALRDRLFHEAVDPERVDWPRLKRKLVETHGALQGFPRLDKIEYCLNTISALPGEDTTEGSGSYKC